MGANGFLAHKIFLADSLDRQEEARRLGEEYLAESRRLGMLQEELIALDHLGVLTFAAGDLDRAEAYTVDALALAREANDRPSLASLDLNMGDILMAKGAYQEALPFLHEALFLVQEIGNETRIALTMEALARCLWHIDKQNLRAVRWMAYAQARLDASGQLRLPFELAMRAEIREELEANLDEATLTRIWAEGESISLEQTLEELLQTLPQTPESMAQ
jgi:tetratricopeptide (TPR) repeat protein